MTERVPSLGAGGRKQNFLCELHFPMKRDLEISAAAAAHV